MELSSYIHVPATLFPRENFRQPLATIEKEHEWEWELLSGRFWRRETIIKNLLGTGMVLWRPT